MRKLTIVLIVLSVLAWPSILAGASHTATQFKSLPIAGDVGPNGG